MKLRDAISMVMVLMLVEVHTQIKNLRNQVGEFHKET